MRKRQTNVRLFFEQKAVAMQVFHTIFEPKLFFLFQKFMNMHIHKKTICHMCGIRKCALKNRLTLDDHNSKDKNNYTNDTQNHS